MRGHKQRATAQMAQHKGRRRLVRGSIKRGKGLVENNCRAGMRERPRKLNAATLPTRELRDRPTQRVLRQQLCEKRVRLVRRERTRRAEQHVLLGSHCLHQPGVLELHGERNRARCLDAPRERGE